MVSLAHDELRLSGTSDVTLNDMGKTDQYQCTMKHNKELTMGLTLNM